MTKDYGDYELRYRTLLHDRSLWQDCTTPPINFNLNQTNQLDHSNPISLTFNQLSKLEELTLTFFGNTSLPLDKVKIRYGTVGPTSSYFLSQGESHGDGTNSFRMGGSSNDTTTINSNSSTYPLSSPFYLIDLDLIELSDLLKLSRLVGTWSTVPYSPNPKKLNLFTITYDPDLTTTISTTTSSSRIDYRTLHQYLYDVLYSHTHDLGPGPYRNLSKLVIMLEIYLFMLHTPGSHLKDLVSPIPFKWLLTVLQDIIKKLLGLEIAQIKLITTTNPETILDTCQSPHQAVITDTLDLDQDDSIDSDRDDEDRPSFTFDELKELDDRIECCLILSVKLVLDRSELRGEAEALVNLLGLCSSRDPFGNRFQSSLRNCSCLCQSHLIRTSSPHELFPITMKWIYYDLTGKFLLGDPQLDKSITTRVNQATEFLLINLDLLELTGLNFLQSFLKLCCTEFNDRAVVRTHLATSLAKLLIHLSYPTAHFLLENLMKDGIRASPVPTRCLTIEIFTSWVTQFLTSTSQPAGGPYSSGEKKTLMVGLIDLIHTRFNDRNLVTCTKAVTAFHTILNLVKSQARRHSPRQWLALHLLDHIIRASFSERFQLTLKECSFHPSHGVRRPSIHLTTSLLRIHLDKYPTYQSDASQLVAFLHATVQIFRDRSRDANPNLRKISFNGLADTLKTAILANQKEYATYTQGTPQLLNATQLLVTDYIAHRSYPFLALETLWSCWVDAALPAMFDSERPVVLAVLTNTSDLLTAFPTDDFLPTLLSRPFPELAFKGIKQIFFMLHHKHHIQQYSVKATFIDHSHVLPPEPHDLTPLMESARFVNFLFRTPAHYPGHWELASAYSDVSQPPENLLMREVVTNLHLIWEAAVEICTIDLIGQNLDSSRAKLGTGRVPSLRNSRSHLNLPRRWSPSSSRDTSNSHTEVVPTSQEIQTWITIGKSLLMIMYHWVPLTSPAFFSTLIRMITELSVPIEWIPAMLQLIRKWYREDPPLPLDRESTDASSDNRWGDLKIFHEYIEFLMEKQLTLCRHHLAAPTADTLFESFDALNKLFKSLFLLGELNTMDGDMDQRESTQLLVQILGRIRSDHATATKRYFFPHVIRSQAFIAFGKITIVNEIYFKQLINMIVYELDLDEAVLQHDPTVQESDIFVLPLPSPPPVGKGNLDDISTAQSSALVVFADLSFRYTSLVELYIPLIANGLRHPHPHVRYLTFSVLTNLLRSDLIKWRDHLSCKFIVALVTERSPEVREFAYYCLIHVLLVKSPSLLLDDFVRLILFVNGYHDYEFASCIRPTATEESLFTFPGSHEIRRRYRHRCYQFVLEHLPPEYRFRLTYLLSEKILTQAAQGKLDTRRIQFHSTQVVKDTFDILGSKEIQIHLPRATPINPDESHPPPEEVDPIHVKKITALTIQNALDNIIPVLVSLKDQLERSYSPLQGAMMQCLGKIITSYHIDMTTLTQLLGNDLLNQLRYDLDRYLMELKATKPRGRKKHPVTPRVIKTPHLTPRRPEIGLYPDTPVVASTTQFPPVEVLPVPTFHDNQSWQPPPSVTSQVPTIPSQGDLSGIDDARYLTREDPDLGPSQYVAPSPPPHQPARLPHLSPPTRPAGTASSSPPPPVPPGPTTIPLDWDLPLTSTPRARPDPTSDELLPKRSCRRNPLRSNRLLTHHVLEGLETLGKENEPLTLHDYLAPLGSPLPSPCPPPLTTTTPHHHHLRELLDDTHLLTPLPPRLPGLHPYPRWLDHPPEASMGKWEEGGWEVDRVEAFLRTPNPSHR